MSTLVDPEDVAVKRIKEIRASCQRLILVGAAVFVWAAMQIVDAAMPELSFEREIVIGSLAWVGLVAICLGMSSMPNKAN